MASDKGLIAAMDVQQFKIDRAKLAAMPETERVLLLLLAHASNELNVLTKLILMMRSGADVHFHAAAYRQAARSVGAVQGARADRSRHLDHVSA
jgi:hypothetical protein